MSNPPSTLKAKSGLRGHQTDLTTLEQLTANIAHEIRNPLSAISHACQLLEEDTSIQKSSKRILEIIASNVQRINQMVDEILHAHHDDPSKIVPIQLNKFLKDFHEHFCEMEKIPAHHFQLDLTGSDTVIQFNPLHLDQILWNLCRNGWRHCQKKIASLRLSLHPISQNLIALAIKNDGDAIPAQTQERVFEPFFTTVAKGTGLGLYISRQLCLRNLAELAFESNQQETIFSIHLQKAVI